VPFVVKFLESVLPVARGEKVSRQKLNNCCFGQKAFPHNGGE